MLNSSPDLPEVVQCPEISLNFLDYSELRQEGATRSCDKITRTK